MTDALVGTDGNDTFVGNLHGGAQTISLFKTTAHVGESVDGKGGNDTLKLISTDQLVAAGDVSSLTISNIENLDISSNAGTVSLNTDDTNNIANLKIMAKGNVSAKAHQAKDVAVKVIGSGDTTLELKEKDINSIDIKGGGDAATATITTKAASSTPKSISITDVGADITIGGAGHTFEVTDLKVAGTKSGVIKVVAEQGKRDLSIEAKDMDDEAAATVNPTFEDATATSVTFKSTGSTLVESTLKFAAAEKLTIEGNAAKTALVTDSTTTALEEIIIKGEGASLKLDNATKSIKKVDASATTKGVTISNLATAKIKDAVKLGAGDDKLSFNGAINTSIKYDAGAGKDTIALESTTQIAAYNSKKMLNFEKVDFSTGATSPTVDMNKFGDLDIGISDVVKTQALTLQNIKDAATIDLTPNAMTALANQGNIVLQIKDDSGDDDSLTLNVGTAKDKEGITYSALTVKTAATNADALETLNINLNSPKLVTFTAFTAGDTEVKDIVIKGDSDLTIGSALVVDTDASGVKGDLTLKIASADITLKAGSGDDTIKVSDTNASVIDISAGGNDTIELTAAKGIPDKVVTVKGAEKGDIIKIGVTNSNEEDVKLKEFKGFNPDSGIKEMAKQALFSLGDGSSGTNASTNGQLVWFNSGNSTYIIASNTDNSGDTKDNITFDATDGIIKLAGTFDLSKADFNVDSTTNMATITLA